MSRRNKGVIHIGDYFLDSRQVVGTGTWASVMKGYHAKTLKPAAIKVVPKKRNRRIDPTPIREIEALRVLSDIPGCVKLYDVYEDPDNFFIVMEYINGTLLSFVSTKGPVPNDLARKIFRQLVETIEAVHKHHYVHRDIKLENVLYDQATGITKLIDFGMCHKFSDEKHHITSDIVGSPGYIAPEILTKVKTGYNGIKTDIYSLGVLLYTMLFGLFPFKDKDNISYYDGYRLTPTKDENNNNNNTNNNSSSSSSSSTSSSAPTNNNSNSNNKEFRRTSLIFPGQISLEAKSLLHHMLVINAEERASFEDVKLNSWYSGQTRFSPSSDKNINNTTNDSNNNNNNNNNSNVSCNKNTQSTSGSSSSSSSQDMDEDEDAPDSEDEDEEEFEEAN